MSGGSLIRLARCKASLLTCRGAFKRRCTVVTVHQKRHNSQHRVMLIPEIPSDTAATNPLLIHQRDGLPNFSKITQANCYFGLGKALIEYEAATSSVDDICSKGEIDVEDFRRLMEILENAKCQFESVWNSSNLLQLTTDGMEEDRYIRVHNRAERAYLTRVDSRNFHTALKGLKAAHLKKGDLLTRDEERIVDRYLLELKQNGFDESEEKFTELRSTWIPRVYDNLSSYRFKIKSLTDRFRRTISDPNIVRDLPVDVLKAMATDSSQPTKGPWTITLHPYIYKQVMAYCPDRNVRWSAHQADVSRGAQASDENLHVTPEIKAIRKHRHDQALTLGYENFVEMSMQTKMAMNVNNVQNMISSMLGKAKHHQELELETLQAFAESRGFEDDIEVYDVDFFQKKQKRSILGVSDEDLRDFFPLPKIMDGLFQICSSMFSIKIEEVKGLEATFWHPDVKLFRLIDTQSGANNKVLGQFYFDPYIRDDKGYAGGEKGWYIPIRNHSRVAKCQPLGAMILSLPEPNYGKPSLLNFAETEELLRNFGSMMIHLCSQSSDWSDLSGKNGLEWDVIDVAGNFMQQWMYVPEVLHALSGHWSSNQPLDQELVGKLCTVSRQLLAGYKLCEELYEAAFDIAFYTEDYEKESYHEMTERIRPDYLLLPAAKGDCFPLYRTDIISGDYPAAMFTKIWAKMLAADAFSGVQEAMPESGILDSDQVKSVTMRYRNTVLSMGSAKPFSEIFRQFRGRDPSHEALLLNLGLRATPHPKKKGQESYTEAKA